MRRLTNPSAHRTDFGVDIPFRLFCCSLIDRDRLERSFGGGLRKVMSHVQGFHESRVFSVVKVKERNSD